LKNDCSVVAVSISRDGPIIAIIFLQLEEAVNQFWVRIFSNKILQLFDWRDAEDIEF